MKTKKIPFDLDRFKRGQYIRVETENGYKVQNLTYFPEATNQSLYGLLMDNDNIVESWHDDGTFYELSRTKSSYDLFLIISEDDKYNKTITKTIEERIKNLEDAIVWLYNNM